MVGQPFAALDRGHEVALDRILLRQCDVVAALYHARAAALAEQALDRDRDRERRVGLMRVQRREQPRAAGAEDQDVGVEGFRNHCMASTTATSPKPIASNSAFGSTTRKPA